MRLLWGLVGVWGEGKSGVGVSSLLNVKEMHYTICVLWCSPQDVFNIVGDWMQAESIADSVKTAAEAAMHESQFIYDSQTGLYYDYISGQYYDAVSGADYAQSGS